MSLSVMDADQLLAVVAPHLDGVVRRAARRARQEIPVYESVPEQEIRQGIARDVAVVLELLRDERPPTDDERQSLAIIGDTRARQHLPLESMLRVYRITLDEVFQAVWRESETGGLEMADALSLTREIWRRADDAMELAVAAYRHRELELAAAESERRRAMLHALLFSPAGAPESMVADAGLDPHGRYLAFRARSLSGESQSVLFDMQLPGVLTNGFAGVHGNDVIGFSSQRPHTMVGEDVVLGVGPVLQLDELSRSFTVATRVVDTAVVFGRSGLLTIGDIALEAIAAGEDALGGELMERYEIDDKELLKTVEMLLACDLNTDRTAEALDVHPNTVRKRISRFEQQSGASLQHLDDVLRVRLAMLRADYVARR